MKGLRKRWLEPALVAVQRSPDVALATAVAGIIAALVVPLPTWALDAGLALNMAGSAGLLVAALYATEPLSVTSFPTLLLVSTLFRLALNVSSTRLALAEGHAGQVIQAFGEFVVRGDYWVGGALFAILAVVQFLVVAKGAERVAEVSARFTLDAMPGKQMSVDADLRAGIIDAAQAQRRRLLLERESQMFGAMDGAMKFVKGDVIAGLLIVAVNLGAGTALGVFRHGMPAGEAMATYALIAIGDGLVSQLPSLCIALAAGLLVTRVAGDGSNGSLGADIARQFLHEPKVAFVVAGLCAALCAIPGIPHFTFALLAALACAVGVLLHRRARADDASPDKAPPTSAPSARPPGGVVPVILELADDLSHQVQASTEPWVTGALERVRERVYLEAGFHPPGIRVRLNASALAPGHYRVLLDEVPLTSTSVPTTGVLARATPEALRPLGLDGQVVAVPGDMAPLTRLEATARIRLEAAGIPSCTALERIEEHLALLLRKHASLLLGLQETRALVDALEPQAPALVQETLQKVPLPLLAEVLRQLLAEDVSVRNLRAICEALASPHAEGDAGALVERCRQGLCRYLSHKYAPEGPLYAYLADPTVEEALRAQGNPSIALDPSKVERILHGMRQIASGGRAVVLTAPDVRRTLRKLCEGVVPEVAVLTYRELDPQLQIRPLGRLAATV